MRALQRLVALVDHHMQAIGGAKMSLPILTPASQWKTSGVHLEIFPVHSSEKSLSVEGCALYNLICVVRRSMEDSGA